VRGGYALTLPSTAKNQKETSDAAYTRATATWAFRKILISEKTRLIDHQTTTKRGGVFSSDERRTPERVSRPRKHTKTPVTCVAACSKHGSHDAQTHWK
jgi:hypothetical protein